MSASSIQRMSSIYIPELLLPVDVHIDVDFDVIPPIHVGMSSIGFCAGLAQVAICFKMPWVKVPVR